MLDSLVHFSAALTFPIVYPAKDKSLRLIRDIVAFKRPNELDTDSEKGINNLIIIKKKFSTTFPAKL